MCRNKSRNKYYFEFVIYFHIYTNYIKINIKNLLRFIKKVKKIYRNI